MKRGESISDREKRDRVTLKEVVKLVIKTNPGPLTFAVQHVLSI